VNTEGFFRNQQAQLILQSFHLHVAFNQRETMPIRGHHAGALGLEEKQSAVQGVA